MLQYHFFICCCLEHCENEFHLHCLQWCHVYRAVNESLVNVFLEKLCLQDHMPRKQTILCRMSALGQNSEKGVRDYCKFNSAWNGSSKRRVRAVLSGYWPMWERGLHWVHGRLQGHFALWIALTILLMPQQEQPSQLLTPGRQESWRERETNKEKKRSGKIFGTVTNHLLAKLQSCIFYLQITI